MARILVIIEKGENSYGAYSPDVPGCVAVADTREEVEQLMHVQFWWMRMQRREVFLTWLGWLRGSKQSQVEHTLHFAFSTGSLFIQAFQDCEGILRPQLLDILYSSPLFPNRSSLFVSQEPSVSLLSYT